MPRAASLASDGSSVASNLSCSTAFRVTFMAPSPCKNSSMHIPPALEGRLVERVLQVRCADGRQHGDLADEGAYAVGLRLGAHAAHVTAHRGHRDTKLQGNLRR